MIPIPLTDATLRLALPFPAASPILRFSFILALGFVFVWFIMRLYHRELRLIPRSTARVLLTLRLMLLGLLAFALVADPTLTRTRTEEVPGRVLIAVDLSDSMRVTDPHRPIAEKLRLAKKLKLVPDLAGESELDSWASDAESAHAPHFASDGERERYEKILARCDATPRLELCRKLLLKDGLHLLESLCEKHSVDLVGFCPEVVPLPAEGSRLEKAFAGTLAEGKPVVCTDLKLPLNRAAEMAANTENAKLLGVILLTDGRHNWGTSPLPKASELGTRGVPVFSIAIAPRDAPADVAIVSARAAAGTVFKGSTVPVDVAVRVTGWPKASIPVTLANPDSKQPPLVETIEHNGTDATYQLTFKAKLDEPGPQGLTVIADAGPNDRFPENNRRNVRINVVKDRARVLLIDGEARWEFHYLHTCLGRDPNMDVRSVVFRQPRIGKVSEEQLRAGGTPSRTLPDDPEALTGYDAIVIGDVELNQMTPAQRKNLEQYVAEAGGTLVISAGKRAMPLAYSIDDPLRKLLPIREPMACESIEGFPVNLTPAGEKSWFLTMADTSGESRAAWENFPPHYWAVVGDLKDGAEALATLNGKALIARQSFGFGRVLYIGIDSTWRWRYKIGDYFHHRFWGQVAQWAASDRLLPVQNAAGTIRFGPREPIYNGGQDVEIVVRIAENVKKLPPEARKAARIIRLSSTVGGAESPAALVPLVAPEGRPRDLQAKVPDLTPGKYAVELDIPDWANELIGPPGPDGRAEKLRATFEVIPPDNDELIDLSANWPLLTELADASGGKVVTPENAAQLVDLLAARTATPPADARTPAAAIVVELRPFPCSALIGVDRAKVGRSALTPCRGGVGRG